MQNVEFKSAGSGRQHGPDAAEVSVWIIDSRDVAVPWRHLPNHELRRLDRFVREQDRIRSALGYVLARAAIGVALTLCVDEVSLTRRCPGCFSDQHGPLTVDNPRGPSPSISLAHSADLAVVATCTSAVVGVDVESVAGFSPADTDSAEQAQEWTRAEAGVKALRCGVRMPLERVRISQGWWHLSAADAAMSPVQPVCGVAVVDVPVKLGYRAAIALVDASPAVVFRDGNSLISGLAQG